MVPFVQTFESRINSFQHPTRITPLGDVDAEEQIDIVNI